MNKQQIMKGLVSRYGDFANVNEVAAYLRVDRGTARAMLRGLEYIPRGNAKLYFVGDIAERLMERKTV